MHIYHKSAKLCNFFPIIHPTNTLHHSKSIPLQISVYRSVCGTGAGAPKLPLTRELSAKLTEGEKRITNGNVGINGIFISPPVKNRFRSADFFRKFKVIAYAMVFNDASLPSSEGAILAPRSRRCRPSGPTIAKTVR